MNKDIAIIAQSTAKAAGQICSGMGIDAVTSGAFSAVFETIFNEVMSRCSPVHGMSMPLVEGAEATFAPGQDAVEDQLVAAFTAPGGQAPVRVDQKDVPIPPPAPAPIAVQGASGPTPGHPSVITLNSSMIECLDDALFHNPSNWKVWDTEKSSLNGGKSADITHEELKNAKGFSHGVWLVDRQYNKRSAPEWAFVEMGKGPQFAALVASGVITP